MLYEYSFVIWSRQLAEPQVPPISFEAREVLEMSKMRLDPSPMSEAQFDSMRSELFRKGWELMEIERRPFTKRETIL